MIQLLCITVVYCYTIVIIVVWDSTWIYLVQRYGANAKVTGFAKWMCGQPRLQDMKEKVHLVFASLFTDRAISYRHDRGQGSDNNWT